MSDAINHPAYYGGDTPYEAIKVIEAWGATFCGGNALKYIARAGKKSSESRVTDLRKARWYIARSIGPRNHLRAGVLVPDQMLPSLVAEAWGLDEPLRACIAAIFLQQPTAALRFINDALEAT